MSEPYLLVSSQRRKAGAKPKSPYYRIAYRDITGKRVIENTHCKRLEDAKDVLHRRHGALVNGLPVTKKAGKIRLDVALKLHIDDLKANAKKSVKDAAQRHKPLVQFFGDARLLATIGLTELRAYVAHRLDLKMARATINRELAAIRRGFRLALDSG